MDQLISKVSKFSRTTTQLGLSLIVTFLVIDILFPGSTGMVANVGVLANSISEKGLGGLVALGLFYVIYTRGSSPAADPESSPPSTPSGH